MNPLKASKPIRPRPILVVREWVESGTGETEIHYFVADEHGSEMYVGGYNPNTLQPLVWKRMLRASGFEVPE